MVDVVSVLVIGALGGLLGLGGLVLVAGLLGHPVLPASLLRPGRVDQSVDQLLIRSALALAGAAATLGATRWPAMALVAAGAAWCSPTWWHRRGSYDRELALTEAVAAWTEQVRDTLAAANGLEHAIGATARLAPAPIAAAVERLAARTDYEPLPDALRRFAEEVAHPMADFVVAALVIAAEKEARDLGALLGQLSEAARDEARMRTRVWVGRARSRSAVRIIVAVVVAFVAALMLFNRAYLRPYDTPSGQFVLAGIIAIFGVSFTLMERLGRIKLPERFIARRTGLRPEPAT